MVVVHNRLVQVCRRAAATARPTPPHRLHSHYCKATTRHCGAAHTSAQRQPKQKQRQRQAEAGVVAEVVVAEAEADAEAAEGYSAEHDTLQYFLVAIASWSSGARGHGSMAR